MLIVWQWITIHEKKYTIARQKHGKIAQTRDVFWNVRPEEGKDGKSRGESGCLSEKIGCDFQKFNAVSSRTTTHRWTCHGFVK